MPLRLIAILKCNVSAAEKRELTQRFTGERRALAQDVTRRRAVMLVATDDLYDGLGLVAFLDILGFSEAALQDWRKVLPILMRIKNATGVASPGVTFVADEQTQTKFLPTVKAISDSVILSVPLPIDRSPLSRLAAFGAMVFNIGFAASACIREGFASRGAIEIGEIHGDVSDIVGPPSSRAALGGTFVAPFCARNLAISSSSLPLIIALSIGIVIDAGLRASGRTSMICVIRQAALSALCTVASATVAFGESAMPSFVRPPRS
jgi:hypothetical protein